jgi:hypothetical protein
METAYTTLFADKMLQWSVCGRQYAMVEFLVKAGADPTFG